MSFIIDAVHQWLHEVDKARGVKGKTEVLKRGAEVYDPEIVNLMEKALKYAYDGTIRFGITIDSIDPPSTLTRARRPFDLWAFSMLDEVLVTSGTREKARLIENALADMDVDDRQLLLAIVKKDLRIGINESTINKAFPGLLTKFDVMLAKPFEERHVKKWPVMIEPKLDGLRVIAEVNAASGEVQFFTRTGKAITSLDAFKIELAELAKHLPYSDGEHEPRAASVAFDGEVTSGSFLESLSSVRKGTEQVTEGTFHIFDALVRAAGHSPIALEDKELVKQGTQMERRQRLTKAFAEFRKENKPEFVELVGSYAGSSVDEVMAYYARSREQGLEGLIIKDPAAYYVKKRSNAWLKIKGKETLDLPVVGAFEGTGKYVGQLGGLIVLNGDVEVRVGGGFSDQQREEYWDAFQADLKLVDAGKRDSCVLIDCLIEVEFQEQMPSGSLRHPVFLRLRRDKTQTAASF